MSELELMKRIRVLEERLKHQEKLEKGGGSIDSWSRAISMYLALPGLRGFWPMSSVDENGGAVNVSGQGRHLSRSGAVYYDKYNDLVPFASFAGGHLSHADHAAFDITGTEGYFTSSTRGLTMLCWFSLSVADTSWHGLMGKSSDATNGYWLYLYDGNLPVAGIGDGASFKQAVGQRIANDQWHFIAVRFVPATSLSLWINGDVYSATSGIFASIPSNAEPFTIGTHWAGTVPGRFSMCALCAAALPDATIQVLYQQTRHLFGV